MALATPALCQKGGKKDGVSYKERLKFERLYIDASKAKILGDYEQSIELYEDCKKIDPKAAAVYFELANLYLNFGRLEEAVPNAKAAVEFESENVYYRIMYAESLKVSGNFKLASEAYTGIIDDFPNQYGAYMDLALIYYKLQDGAKVIEVYDRLEKNFGPNEEIKLEKQALYLKIGKLDKAVKEIESLISLFPDNIKYYLLLAEVYSVNDQQDKAVKAYKEALDKFPENPEISLSLARYYNARKEYKKGLEYLEMAFSNPDLDIDLKVQTLLSLFDIIDRDGGYVNDIERLGSLLLKIHPNDARILTLNGDIQLNSGAKELARSYFKSAIKIDDSRYPIWNQLLILDADLDYIDSLIEDAQAASELFPNQPVCFYFLGYAQSRKKDFQNAVKSYDRGLKVLVDNDLLKLQFLLGLGDAYNELKEFDASDRAFEKAISIDPENTIALNNYSYYLSERGHNLEKALEMSSKVIKLEGNSSTYLDTYAWILYKMKNYTKAKNYMQKALDSGGIESGVILEHMGDVCFQLDEVDLAIDYWEKASEKSDHSELLQQKLNDKKLYE
ncbi:MAG: tetratricopeptide repeat protein [Vicingaceae bacterium]